MSNLQVIAWGGAGALLGMVAFALWKERRERRRLEDARRLGRAASGKPWWHP